MAICAASGGRASGWGDDNGWNIVEKRGTVRVPAIKRLDLSSPPSGMPYMPGRAPRSCLRRSSPDDLTEGRLVQFGERHGEAEEIWIVHASGRLPRRKLRALIDVTVAFFEDESLTAQPSL